MKHADFAALLKEKKMRPSYQRIRILQHLTTHQNHPSADEIYQALKDDIPALSKSTVYKTLLAFEEAGLVKAISYDGTSDRFDLKEHNHSHFQCKVCNRLYDFDIDLQHAQTQGLQAHHVTERTALFKGICQTCLAKNNPEEASR